MKLAIMQPYFFPYIGYFQLINHVDEFILYEDIKHIKKGWVNKNRIYEINKGIINITVPLKKHKSDELISNINIDNFQNWNTKILNSIFFNYKKTNHFEEIYPHFEEMLKFKSERISTINYDTLNKICKLLNIKTKIRLSNKEFIDIENKLLDYNQTLFNIETKTKRILDICKKGDYSTYINPIGGKLIYNKETFKENGIELGFVETKSFVYPQNSHNFIPNLSIIDVLFNCGVQETKLILNYFSLV